jgi:hypothetical protein
MSPPSNDPRAPKGHAPQERPRLDRTILERETVEFVPPAPPARSVTTFGLAPMVTQPFAAFAPPPSAPATANAPPGVPAARADAQPVMRSQPAAQVSVGRVQGIGHQPPSAVTPPAEAAPTPPQSFDRTFIASGHRPLVDPRVPGARPLVPAYPSQPYTSQPPASAPAASAPYASQPPASAPAASTPYASQPPASAPAASTPYASQPQARADAGNVFAEQRSSVHEAVVREQQPPAARQQTPLPRDYEPLRSPQQAPTTCVDVSELLRYPVPMPEVRLDEDSSTAWSGPMVEAARYTPQPRHRPQVQSAEPTHKDLGQLEPRLRRNTPSAPSDGDDIDVDRVLGRSNKKVPLLAGAVAIALGLLAVSLYVKHTRDDAAAALAAAPVAAPLSADPTTSSVGAPTLPEQEPDQEPPPPRRAREARQPAPEELPAQDQELRGGREAAPETQHDATTDQAPAVHTAAGGVTAKSAAALYINGQYKEALAEYQLLARAYPKQQVYSELARILRRKLIETCMRTQPNRREQCKSM